MKTKDLNKCKFCDFCTESKQGIKCFNPKSESFNQIIKLDEVCEYIELNYYVHTKDEEDKGLFNEVLH